MWRLVFLWSIGWSHVILTHWGPPSKARENFQFKVQPFHFARNVTVSIQSSAVSLCKRRHFARAVTLQETSLCKRPHFARAVTLQVTSLCKGRHFTTWRLSYSFEATKWCEKRLDPALLYVTVSGNERLNFAIWENGSSFYGFGTSYDIFFLLSFLLVKFRSVILETKYFETKKEIQVDANKLFLIC